MNRYIRLAGLSITFAMQGCESMMFVSKNDAAASPLSVRQFVEENFIRGVLPWDKDKKKTPDGGVLYNAYFTNANPNLLYVPVRDLKTFCEAKGGKFLTIEGSKTSAAILGTPHLSKNDVFYGRRAAYKEFGFDEKLANTTAAYDAQFYEQVTRAYYPPSARNILAAADQFGAFGKFVCESQNKPAWIATIEPLKYLPPRDASNLLDPPGLSMYIKAEPF